MSMIRRDSVVFGWVGEHVILCAARNEAAASGWASALRVFMVLKILHAGRGKRNRVQNQQTHQTPGEMTG